MYKGVMRGNYFRINPTLSKEIKLDKFEEKDEMTKQVKRYLNEPETQALVKSTIDSILTADNYYEKALGNLMKTCLVLKYSEYLE
jgi:hypothetical protein